LEEKWETSLAFKNIFWLFVMRDVCVKILEREFGEVYDGDNKQ